MPATDLVLAITGASGAPYGVRLLDVLLSAGRAVHLVISPAAVEVMERELERTVRLDRFDPVDLLGDRAHQIDTSRIRHHHYQDFQAGIASGSFLTGPPTSTSRSGASSSWCRARRRWGWCSCAT
jgi:4-hydroxy-3-polyprenylbenzoate decarboxylase